MCTRKIHNSHVRNLTQTALHQESKIPDCHRGFTSSRFKARWRIVLLIFTYRGDVSITLKLISNVYP
ncbi:hypothetical protein FJZ18_03970 [Candidatus Pacearchaeota archaeon]|nr:hypothetical protein [Candidatus Pacearchaeota archaeon]